MLSTGLRARLDKVLAKRPNQAKGSRLATAMPLGFLKSLVSKFSARPVDWDELEETLLRADLGVPMTLRILDALRERGDEVDAETAAEVCRREILEVIPAAAALIPPLPAKPKAILLVGVNGTGKTTSAAKLAYWFKENRHTNLLVAADTFRRRD